MPLPNLFIQLPLDLIFVIGSEVLIRTKIDQKDLFSAHLSVFHKSKTAKTENAAFGDSLIARGFHANDNHFINLGLGGESPFRTNIKLRAFFEETEPKNVILIASPLTWFVNDPTDPNSIYSTSFRYNKRPYFRMSEPRNRYFALHFWKAFIVNGELREKTEIMRYGGMRETDEESERQYSKLSEDERIEDSKRLLRTYSQKSTHIKHILGLYADMIAFINSRGGRVCLLSTPFSPSFRNVAKNQLTFGNKHRNLWHDLALQNGAVFVDLYNYVDDNFYFLDFQHLNNTGATKIRPVIDKLCFSGG